MKTLNELIEIQKQEARVQHLFFYSKDVKSREDFIVFLDKALLEIAHATVEAVLGKRELHTHDSIPNYTAGLKDGCVVCRDNAAISEQEKKAEEWLKE